MEQRRFWGARRNWTKKPKRAVKTEFNAAKQIFEAVEKEEHVVKAIIAVLWYSGIPVFRERERIPACPHCGKYVSRTASDPGHPDLHGYIPGAKIESGRPLPFYIEVKRPVGGIESESQKEFVRRAQEHGVLAFFARSIQDVKQAFQTIGVEVVGG